MLLVEPEKVGVILEAYQPACIFNGASLLNKVIEVMKATEYNIGPKWDAGMFLKYMG